jgi:alginate O-acetyltransferase complex protein AlgI
VNHLWRHLAGRLNIALPRTLAWTITLAVVLFAWVPFRADTFAATMRLWTSMAGLDGLSGPTEAGASLAMVWIIALSAIALFAPNTQEILLQRDAKASKPTARWQPSISWAIAMGCVYGITVAGMIEKPTVFLYFRF